MNRKVTYPEQVAGPHELKRALKLLSALSKATDDTATAIQDIPDLAEADRLAVEAREIAERITKIRYLIVARAYELEGGSSTRVADRLGLSNKQRADQLIRAARKAGCLPPVES